MSEWQPIDTAPKDGRAVLVGRWIPYLSRPGELFWSESTGIVWRKQNRGLLRLKPGWVRTFDSEYYSHWKPLPEAPK